MTSPKTSRNIQLDVDDVKGKVCSAILVGGQGGDANTCGGSAGMQILVGGQWRCKNLWRSNLI